MGRILYYDQAIEIFLLIALSTLSDKQYNATEFTMDKVEQLLDYCTTHPDPKIKYQKSIMILNIYSDATHLCTPKASSKLQDISS